MSLASTLEEFAARAEALWNHGTDSTDREAVRDWHDQHLDPEALDRRLREIVLG